ncbi:hypothetical protein VaNZ11_003465, partial [Volvox africanus]
MQVAAAATCCSSTGRNRTVMNDATEDHQPTVEPRTAAIANPDPSEEDKTARPDQAVGVTGTAAACKPAAAGSTANNSGTIEIGAAESTNGGIKGTAAGDRASGTDHASATNYLGTGDDAAAVADISGSDSVAAANISNAAHENSSVADGPRAAGPASAGTTDCDARSTGTPASRITQRHIPSVAGGEKPVATTASIEFSSAINTREVSPLVEGASADEAHDRENWRGRKGISEESNLLGNMSLKEPLIGLETCEERITVVGTGDNAPGTTAATGSRPTSAATLPVTLCYGVGVAGETLQPLDTQLPGDSAITSGGKKTSSPGDAAQSIALAGAKQGRHPERADSELRQEQEESNESISTSEKAATGQLEPDGPSGRQSPSDMEAGTDASPAEFGLAGDMAETSSAGVRQAQGPDEAAANLEYEFRQERFTDDAAGGARLAEALAPSVMDMAGDLNSIDVSAGE